MLASRKMKQRTAATDAVPAERALCSGVVTPFNRKVRRGVRLPSASPLGQVLGICLSVAKLFALVVRSVQKHVNYQRCRPASDQGNNIPNAIK